MAVHIFISWNLYTLRERGVDLYCRPGTHDFVCFDILLVYIQYADLLLYFNANTEHGKKIRTPRSKKTKPIKRQIGKGVRNQTLQTTF